MTDETQNMIDRHHLPLFIEFINIIDVNVFSKYPEYRELLNITELENIYKSAGMPNIRIMSTGTYKIKLRKLIIEICTIIKYKLKHANQKFIRYNIEYDNIKHEEIYTYIFSNNSFSTAAINLPFTADFPDPDILPKNTIICFIY